MSELNELKPLSRSVRRAIVAGAFLGSAVAALLVCSTALALWSKVVAGGPQTVSTVTLGAPTGLTAAVSGHDVSLAWSAGTNGTGYAVRGVANGSSSDCTSASFAAVGTSASTSYADSGRFSPQGTYFCYQVLTSRSNWTSVSSNPTAVAQIGFVVTSVSVSNGAGAALGKLDSGDQLVLTFNQPVSTVSGPSGTNSLCTLDSGTNSIMLGSTTTTGACAATESLKLGKLTGGSADQNSRYTATYIWSNGNKTLTITIGSRTSGSKDAKITGSWLFAPTLTTTNLLSASGSFHVCDTSSGGGVCLPALSGSF